MQKPLMLKIPLIDAPPGALMYLNVYAISSLVLMPQDDGTLACFARTLPGGQVSLPGDYFDKIIELMDIVPEHVVPDVFKDAWGDYKGDNDEDELVPA